MPDDQQQDADAGNEGAEGQGEPQSPSMADAIDWVKKSEE